MQLWALFKPTSNGAHKNQCTDQVMSCSYKKQPSPISWVSICLWACTNFSFSRLWNQKIWPYILQILAREVKICLQDPFSVMRLSTSKVRWKGIMSMSGEQQILISPSSMKEIHPQWMCSMPFQRKFTALSSSWKIPL